MLSAIVYRHEDPSKDDKRLAVYEKALRDGGWQRRGICNRNEKGDGHGLYFEVWENDSGKQRRIIFAFRGTTGGPDWGANLRWFRLHKPRDHYVAAREECLPLIEKYYNEPGRRKPIISTTGHSLGGGVAQEILYSAADKVDHCVVFDPSPVTELQELKKSVQDVYRHQLNRSEFSQYRIIRAYERGEILMFARNIISLFYKPDTQTQSIEFNAPGRLTAVGKHSITLLTDHIIDLANQDVSPNVGTSYDPNELSPPLRPVAVYKEDPNYRPEGTRTRR